MPNSILMCKVGPEINGGEIYSVMIFLPQFLILFNRYIATKWATTEREMRYKT